MPPATAHKDRQRARRAASAALSTRAAVFWVYTGGFFLSCVLRSANASLDDLLHESFRLDQAAIGFLSSLFFLSFAATQLPLGYLIDRIGPRRAQLVVLPLAIAGLALAAYAPNFFVLAVSRALLGVGFAISLMASLCANRAWFPIASLAAVNGAAIGIGSSGAVFAGAPLAGVVRALGWTQLHLWLAAATALVLVLLYALPQDRPQPRSSGVAGAQIVRVLRDPVFVRLVPVAALAQGSYLAWLGYWIHPWLRAVAGFDADAASLGLSLAAVTMVTGTLLTGAILRFLARWGYSLEQSAIVGMLSFAVSGFALALLPAKLALPLWLLYGFTGSLNVVAFSVLSASLPQSIQGAAVTLLNLLIFTVGFAVQAGLGIGIEWLTAAGIAPSTAHRLSLLAVATCLLLLAASWRRLRQAAAREG